MSDYPMVALIARHGRVMAAAASLLPVLAAVAATAVWGLTPAVIFGGLLAAPIVYVLAASYVELIRIVWDTLVPK